MGISMIKATAKQLAKVLGKEANEIRAFSRQYDPKIGEELTHKITGRRFFKASELHSKNVDVLSCPVEITKDGYKGISKEYFDALKKMKIKKKTGPYGGNYIQDDFTGNQYWARKRTDGSTLAMTEGYHDARHSIPTSLWEKIQSLFQ